MITQLEAHLILRALRNGDPYGYGTLLLRSKESLRHLYAMPYSACICTCCGLVQLQYCASPVSDGCADCGKTAYVGQQYWVYHSNMLHYFANVSAEEHQYFETALQLMWELQENVSL